ncbi:MAG: DUF7471 family protein [Natronomonas sp.]
MPTGIQGLSPVLGPVLQQTSELSPVVYPVLVVATAGTTTLFVLSLVVYWRRLSAPFLLVTVAIGLLVVRSVVGFGTVVGLVPMTVHHVLEHGFDFLIAALVLVAAYLSRSKSPVPSGEPP